MLTKFNINTKLKTLIKVFNDDFLSENYNERLDRMLNNFVEKYKHTEHFLNSIVIKIVVRNNFILKEELNFKDILYVYEIHKIILLKKILVKETKKYENKEVTVCLILDDREIIDLHKVEDYALSSIMNEINNENNHKSFENSLKKEKSFYVKHSRQSILNTLYSNNQKKIFRQNSKNKFTKLEKMRDIIKNKYINIHCPICNAAFDKLSNYEKEDYKLHTFEITEDTIDDIIHVEKNIKRISFNCLHEEMNVVTSKFFIEAKKYNVDLDKEDKRKVQIWFLKNLKFLFESRLNEIN